MGYQPGIENESLEGRIAGRVRRRRKRRRKEATLEGRSIDQAAELGWLSRKMNGLGFRHWPDRYFIPPKIPAKKLRTGPRRLAYHTPRQGQRRRGFWVEFKKPGQEPTRAQHDLHENLRARGERVYTIDTDADFERTLRAEHDCTIT